MFANENALKEFFSLELLREKILKYPGKLRENSGNFVSQKCGHPDTVNIRLRAAALMKVLYQKMQYIFQRQAKVSHTLNYYRNLFEQKLQVWPK